MMEKRTLNIIRLGGLSLGLIFLAYCLYKLGLNNVLRGVSEVRWWAFAVLANSFLWYLVYTAAWRNYFSNLAHHIPFTHLLRIKMCGEAVNLSTPLSWVAGDPVRAMLLAKHLGKTTRFGSVIVDRLLHSLATVTFVLTGVIFVFFVAGIIPVGVKKLLLGVYLSFVLILGFVVAELVKGKGFKMFHPFLAKTGIARRFPKLDEHLMSLNQELSGFAGGSAWMFLESFFYHFLGRLLGVTEIAILFLALTGAPHLGTALILTALTNAINLVCAIVPGALGILESFYAGFFIFHGLDPALGVSMQIIRRLRALFWIIVGVILLNRHNKKT